MRKRIEIIIPGLGAIDPGVFETLLLNKGDLRVETEFPEPVPIYARQDPLTGRVDYSGRGFVVGYRPGGTPRFYIVIEEEEKKEDRLFLTARSLLDYCQEVGVSVFRGRFGSLDILEVCREIVEEGEGKPHPWRDRRGRDLPSRDEDLADHG